MMQPPTRSPPSALKARLIALPVLAAGCGVAWYFGFEALRQARAGAARIDFSGKALLLASLLLFAGAFLLIGGRPVLEAFSGPPRGRQQHAIVWPMFILACLAGGAGWWWLRGQLHALGYTTA